MRQRGIIVHTKTVLSIKEMRRIAYKKIFEKLSYDEECALENSIKWWPKKENLTKDQRGALKSIIDLLIINEDKGFEEMKIKVISQKLDYKQMYGV